MGRKIKYITEEDKQQRYKQKKEYNKLVCMKPRAKIYLKLKTKFGCFVKENEQYKLLCTKMEELYKKGVEIDEKKQQSHKIFLQSLKELQNNNLLFKELVHERKKLMKQLKEQYDNENNN